MVLELPPCQISYLSFKICRFYPEGIWLYYNINLHRARVQKRSITLWIISRSRNASSQLLCLLNPSHLVYRIVPYENSLRVSLLLKNTYSWQCSAMKADPPGMTGLSCVINDPYSGRLIRFGWSENVLLWKSNESRSCESWVSGSSSWTLWKNC